jgi:Mg2+ and Co2+ transporter CorA
MSAGGSDELKAVLTRLKDLEKGQDELKSEIRKLDENKGRMLDKIGNLEGSLKKTTSTLRSCLDVLDHFRAAFVTTVGKTPKMDPKSSKWFQSFYNDLKQNHKFAFSEVDAALHALKDMEKNTGYKLEWDLDTESEDDESE